MILNDSNYETVNLKNALSPLNVGCLAFGCIIGWGAFIMPGNVFLPSAGPIGSIIAMVIAGIIMSIFAVNYHFMVNKYPCSGGECLYAEKTFGRGHAYWCSWFLGLSYLLIVPLNATALSLIGRNLMGNIFQRGFHYTIAGYHVWAGEIILAEVALILFGIISIIGVRTSGIVQTILCFLLISGIVLITVICVINGKINLNNIKPYYSNDKALLGIVRIIMIAPWAFVGFDTIPQATEEFDFSAQKTLKLMLIAIWFGTLIYITINIVTAVCHPACYQTWSEYIGNIEKLTGIESLPTFFAGYSLLGNYGLILLGVSSFGAICTGIMGFYMATSRLLYSLSKGNYIPKRMGILYKKTNTPYVAILFVMGISMIFPFLGRNALTWLVDMSSLGAAIGYGYTSASTFKNALSENKVFLSITGCMGVILAFLFAIILLVPIKGINASLSKEAYISLLVWIVLGEILYIFRGKGHT